MEFANELYEHGALEEKDFNMLNNNKNNYEQNKLEIEKDDIEH